jgi:hypothetical protein
LVVKVERQMRQRDHLAGRGMPSAQVLCAASALLSVSGVGLGTTLGGIGSERNGEPRVAEVEPFISKIGGSEEKPLSHSG